MNARVTYIGNEVHIVLSKEDAERLGLADGQELATTGDAAGVQLRSVADSPRMASMADVKAHAARINERFGPALRRLAE